MGHLGTQHRSSDNGTVVSEEGRFENLPWSRKGSDVGPHLGSTRIPALGHEYHLWRQ